MHRDYRAELHWLRDIFLTAMGADEAQIEASFCSATFGSGSPVILLHGGLGHGGNWGYQVPVLVKAGYGVVPIDSRGHSRSTRDSRPFRYELMASDVLAVMDTLRLEKATVAGWRSASLFTTHDFCGLAVTQKMEKTIVEEAGRYAFLGPFVGIAGLLLGAGAAILFGWTRAFDKWKPPADALPQPLSRMVTMLCALGVFMAWILA